MDRKKQRPFNEKAHNLSLSRRSLCVRKKASELAVLCDALVCLMQFDQEGQLKTFPEDASEVNNVLKRCLRAGGVVPGKRKISGLTFPADRAKKPDPVLDNMHENDERSPPSLGDRFLDTKSSLELQSFKHVLDVKMKQLEERINLLKGTKSPKKKQQASTFLRFYEDGTPFNPDDLQLSCNFSGCEPFSKHEGVELAASPDHSLLCHHLGLAANSVTDDGFYSSDSFCPSEELPTNCSCDSDILKRDSADREDVRLENMTTEDSMRQQRRTHNSCVAEGTTLLLKGDESAEKRRKTGSFQLFCQDGMRCSSGDVLTSANHCSSISPFFQDYKGLAVHPTNLLLPSFQSSEAATNVVQERSLSSKVPCSDGSSWDNRCVTDNAKEEHNGLEDRRANNNSTLASATSCT